MKIAYSLLIIRVAVVLCSVAATVLLPLSIGIDGFGEYACSWALLMLGGRFASLGTAKFLLKELPARHALGIQEIPLRRTIIWVILTPAVLSVTYGLALWFLESLFGSFAFLNSIPWYPAWAAVGSYALHILAVVAVGARLLWGTWAIMFIRDGSHHLAALGLLAYSSFSSNTASSVFFLVGVVAALAVLNTVMIPVLLLSGTFRLSHDSVDLEYNTLAFWANDLSGSIINSLDIIVSGMLFPAAVAGKYALARKLTNLASFPQSIANDWASVRIATAFANQKLDEIKKVCHATLRFTVPISILAALVIYFAASWWFLFVQSNGFVEVQLLLIFLLTGNLVSVFFGQNFTLASQTGLEKQAFYSRWTGVLVFVSSTAGCFLILGQVWSIAVGQLLAMAIANFYIWKTVRKTNGVDSSIRGLFI